MCDPNPCYHQGTCETRPEGYKCLCPSSYTGPRCEHITADRERPLAIILGVFFASFAVLVILLVLFCLYRRSKRKTIIEVREVAPPGEKPQLVNGPVIIANGKPISLPPSVVSSGVRQPDQTIIIKRPQQLPSNRIIQYPTQPKSILRKPVDYIDSEIYDDEIVDLRAKPNRGSINAEIHDGPAPLDAVIRDDIDPQMFLDNGRRTLPY